MFAARNRHLRRKVVSFLDACDAALDPVYFFFEAGLASWLEIPLGNHSESDFLH